GAGWHVRQQQKALARGGLWGQPIDDALWSHSYVPLSHTDSMFATLGEVLGFAGILLILAAIALWILFGLRQAGRCTERFPALTIAGLTLMVGIQAVVHVSVCLGLLPPTGVTLPFLSYGGSSLIATMATVGLIIACRPNQAAETVETPPAQ
ncbi:MAG: FtsW/RodA/SpoVE family cell cycle protein, partial [Sulfitobacter sp.]|nr:FtsW/RodA/SpoVE family cell cycle protein [Sulfitobacter sp.]